MHVDNNSCLKIPKYKPPEMEIRYLLILGCFLLINFISMAEQNEKGTKLIGVCFFIKQFPNLSGYINFKHSRCSMVLRKQF